MASTVSDDARHWFVCPEPPLSPPDGCAIRVVTGAGRMRCSVTDLLLLLLVEAVAVKSPSGDSEIFTIRGEEEAYGILPNQEDK